MKHFRNLEMKKGLCAVVGLWIGFTFIGCQSRPAPDVHYYLLQPSATDLAQGDVEVSSITIPGYLKMSNIALAVSDNEIRPAQYHLWSESLEDGIRRVLEAELASELKQADREEVSLRIDLEIEIFHATESGLVLLKGTWRLRGEDAKEQGFSIQTNIAADGYSAAVRAQVSALSTLAKTIVGAL